MASLYKRKNSKYWWVKYYLNGIPKYASTHCTTEAGKILKISSSSVIRIKGSLEPDFITTRGIRLYNPEKVKAFAEEQFTMRPPDIYGGNCAKD
jgi:hypothetical protein